MDCCHPFTPFIALPATCELCQQWLPNHTANCPRKGKPPSQWSRGDNDDNEDDIIVDTDIQRVEAFKC
ncbi:hypothetical protein K450DRAFT_278256 [Umbelopsis ramanniana AG]|uniref:Uncharacterized protein n=1 Tax=Umbelopsis ramanniana AG TaxID=1314678 RepID=A0AAD5EF66_UMBRA|nr:uncharacterized protein K450DRAFT_278256 [Umbelopsis ramanniana AG]KAI8582578.1 hypothetical protein K450DRAFT_278256 [Umbelopsis ramanniana AG]